jgi:twitching motility protein PilT
MTDLIKLLQLGKSKGASDLHVVVDRPALYRINGSLIPVDDMPVLSAADIEQALKAIVTEKEMADFTRTWELDFGRTVPEVGRVRFNAAMQRGTISLVVRLLPSKFPPRKCLACPLFAKTSSSARGGW